MMAIEQIPLDGSLPNVTGRAQVVKSIAIDPSTGSAQTALAPGRAAAASSAPMVLSNEDLAVVRQTYRRVAAVGATAGDALLVTGVTAAGTVNVTLSGGGSITINVPVGSSIWPFAASAAALGNAVGGAFQSLFFS